MEDNNNKNNNNGEGGPNLADVERPLLNAAANKPGPIDAAGELGARHGNVPPGDIPKLKSPEGSTFKLYAINTFLSVSIVAGAIGVGLYFVVTAAKRKECIQKLLAKYPQLQTEESMKRVLESIGPECVGVSGSTTPVAVGRGAGTMTCDQINDAYNMLDECDNTLLHNVLAAMSNAARDVARGAQNVADALLPDVGAFFSKYWWIFVAGIGGIVVLLLAAKFMPQMLARAKRESRPTISFGKRSLYSQLRSAASAPRGRRLAR